MPDMQIVKVIVRGELPKGCLKCQFKHVDTGVLMCMLTWYEKDTCMDRTKRMPNCPLVHEDEESET